MGKSSTQVMMEILDKYDKKYMREDAQGKVIFKEFAVIRSDWMGQCELGYPCKITIQKAMEGHNIWSQVILWHEFCHAWAYHEEKHKGHGWPFLRRNMTKPLHFIAQVPCCFVFVFLEIYREYFKGN